MQIKLAGKPCKAKLTQPLTAQFLKVHLLSIPAISGHMRTTYSRMAGVTVTLRPCVIIFTVLTAFAVLVACCAAWHVQVAAARLRECPFACLHSRLCGARCSGAWRSANLAARQLGGANPRVWVLQIRAPSRESPTAIV